MKTLDEWRQVRRDGIAGGQVDLAARAMGAFSELLGEAYVFPEGVGGSCENAGITSLGRSPLSIELFGNRAKIVIVEDTFVAELEESECDGPEYGIGSGHLGITLRIDVETVS